MKLTVEQILALPPGPDLDRAVHSQALGRPGRAPLYSTKQEVAVDLIAQLPIGVARLAQNAPGYRPEKPFVAFLLEKSPRDATYFAATSVASATLAVALCRMALLFTVSPKERQAPPPNQAPRIGSNMLVPRQLDPMPERIKPKVPPIPGAEEAKA